MNPLADLSAAVKLTLTLVALVLVGLLLWWLSTFFSAKTELKAIRRGDAAIAAQAKVNNAKARARDAETDALATATRQQADALAKDLARENARFDSAARAEYYRLLNHALRGAE
mgnify:CR=1 FL=1